MNNAIIGLMRGYRELPKYDWLIKRNIAIREHIGTKYPLVIFHEGNIGLIAQSHIRSFTPELLIEFVNISSVWSGGYEGMCQFQTFHVWNFCKEFDYVLRVDEDCHIIKTEADPFDQVGDNVYLRSVYWAESHSETNATLPFKIASLTHESPARFYNNKYPYTNVSLSKVSFWTDKKMNDLLYMIAMCPDQRKNRWGDLPVLGSLLNIYAEGKVGVMTGLSYSHLSHGNIIHSA